MEASNHCNATPHLVNLLPAEYFAKVFNKISYHNMDGGVTENIAEYYAPDEQASGLLISVLHPPRPGKKNTRYAEYVLHSSAIGPTILGYIRCNMACTELGASGLRYSWWTRES